MSEPRETFANAKTRRSGAKARRFEDFDAAEAPLIVIDTGI